MKVYTRKGDDGSTALADGRRVGKDASRVAAYGDVDELNAVLGRLRAEALPLDGDSRLARVQSVLFEIGAFLADPDGRFELSDDACDPAWLEGWIDELDHELPPLRNFILPAGARAAVLAHVGRTVCRRAERAVVGLRAESESCGRVLPVLNRLSDLLFVLARWLNLRAGVGDVVWRPGRR